VGFVRNKCYFSQTEHAPQLSAELLIGPGEGAVPGAGCGNAVDRAAVKCDIAFYFLQDLMNVAVQHRDGSEPLKIGKVLRAISVPSPTLIDRP